MAACEHNFLVHFWYVRYIISWQWKLGVGFFEVFLTMFEIVFNGLFRVCFQSLFRKFGFGLHFWYRSVWCSGSMKVMERGKEVCW